MGSITCFTFIPQFFLQFGDLSNVQCETKTLKLVAPLINQLERQGYCIAFIDSKPTERKRSVMRNTVKIPFDTRIKNKNQAMELPDGLKECSVDEDPMSDCSPVDCEIYYNGHRSYYNKKSKRCVDVPSCISKSGAELPNIIYNPIINKCVDAGSLVKEDIEYVKAIAHGHERKAKNIVIIKNLRKPHNNFSRIWMKGESPKIKKCKSANDMPSTKLKPAKDTKPYENKDKSKSYISSMAYYLSANRFTLSVLGVVISVQCFLICTMIYFLTRHCCCNRKKVVRKYFNYRQDASVTTPLIGTSNIDTETTDYQYVSESSNIDKKIKCYKACQKERNNKAKQCLSDDILSKCLNRRDWNSKPIKSEAIQEYNAKVLQEKTITTEKKSDIVKSKPSEMRPAKKSSEVKVNFENEKSSKHSSDRNRNKIVKSIVKKLEGKTSKTKKPERTELNGSDIVLSEKEIKCHSYNYMDTSNVTSVKQSQESYNATGFKPSSLSNQKLGFFRTAISNKDTGSLSTEKGAQACFSNDSIDDFLSERGMLYLAGEDISKYSFSIDSNVTKPSITSEISSKTSKNNVVKNVLSFLYRRSKHGPLSDPGTKKSKDSLNLELIHMSNASVYSSSNNDSDCLKTFKRMKDSRTSL